MSSHNRIFSRAQIAVLQEEQLNKFLSNNKVTQIKMSPEYFNVHFSMYNNLVTVNRKYSYLGIPIVFDSLTYIEFTYE
jgi:hypothetical protein